MRMTKTLTAAAVGAALTLSAAAAAASSVSLYGIIDEGLLYRHERVNGVSSNSVSEKSGLFAPSRWGMKGTEDLGDGLKVGFKIESGFNADSGTLANPNKLFHRESALSVSGSFGTLAAGRMGAVGSNSGTYDTVYATAEVSDGGWENVLGLFMSDRYDNMLTYQSPKFAGLQATLQYSFKGNDGSTGTEGTAKVDRYYGGSLTYEIGAFQAVAAYEYMNRANDQGANVLSIRRNGQIASLGGNYDFGAAKVFGMVQYADGVDRFGFFGRSDVSKALGISDASNVTYDGFKGWAAHLGASAPVCGGTLLGGVYYADAETQQVFNSGASQKDVDGKFIGVNLQYNYPLSKRTIVYCGASYGQTKLDGLTKDDEQKSEVSQGYVGLAHFF